jgi:hypothetical protein
MKASLIAAGLAISSIAPTSAFAGQDCAALANLKIEDTNLLSAAEVPASGGLPAYCRVLGYVRPAINFEIKLPLQGWNGKFYMVGCGGFCGTIDSEAPGFFNAMNFGLRRNYAVSVSDSGHWGASTTDARWAINNSVAMMDFAQRSVPETARISKVILRAYYETEQKKSYFAGCSTGERMAIMAALRNPKDFDGIISGAPALDQTHLNANLHSWVAKANSGPNGKSILSPAKVRKGCMLRVARKLTRSLPIRGSHFKPSTLQCRAGDSADCLTQAEVGAAEKIYSGPINSRGQRLYPSGVPLGSELFWPLWLGRMPILVQSLFSYVAFDPSFKVNDYDFDKDPPRLANVTTILNAATFNPSNGEIEFDDIGSFR